MRRILLFPVPLLLFFLTAATCTAAPAAQCPKKCGEVNISYPFGVGEGCFRDGFELHCNDTGGDGIYKLYTGTLEVIDMSLVESQVRVFNLIGFACYDSSGYPLTNQTNNTYLRLSNTPFRLSDTRNKFTAIGCRTLAYIKDFSTPGHPYMSGCLSICQKSSNFTDGAACTGTGCCQTSIPKDLDYYKVSFDSGFNHGYVWDFSSCSYAFVADDDWYKFNSSDVHKHEVFNRNNGNVPVVLDWAIRTESCEKAKLNKTAYACVSKNSVCMDSTNGPGYTCSCSIGYQGNPYIEDEINGACQDIDECQAPKQHGCFGKCTNWPPGNFTCSCPSGTQGTPDKQGGCEQKLSLLFKILMAGLCSFLIAAVMYVVYEKTKLSRSKQKCFRQNGGLLLQEQINAHQGVRFKIFSIEEMERATNNFHERQIKGRGGQGIVYEGTLDDKRKAAIKKAIMIDDKKKKDFAKEMYILSLINHKNVVKILGCCLEVEVPILVYEFISRVTLYQLVQDKNQRLPLGFRLKVVVDSASALAYLHIDASPSIVHGDVKSSNILLDDEYKAKISDFGASLLPFKDVNESGVPGTYGYLDPESMETGQLTEKSDVYSFAVVILEVLTRKKAVYSEGPREKRILAQTFREQGLASILDDEIRCQITEANGRI